MIDSETGKTINSCSCNKFMMPVSRVDNTISFRIHNFYCCDCGFESKPDKSRAVAIDNWNERIPFVVEED